MIYIYDDFLPENIFQVLKSYTTDGFQKVDMPGKSFWVKKAPDELVKLILKKIQIVEGKKINNILCFIRQANSNQDDEWRIHNDSIIEGQKPERALVYYITSPDTELNGTAFWSHNKYGDTYPIDKDTTEFDRMLNEDANNMDLWTMKSLVGFKENRLLSYPCNYFHSKYPNKFQDSRVVLVMFYNFVV